MTRCLSCMKTYEGQNSICPHCGYEQNTPPREAYHLIPGTILQGRYIVGKVLGYGGFGVTYIGFDAKLERVVAVKEFLPTTFATRLPGDTHLTVYNSGNANEQFGTGLNRFVEEAQTLAQFNGVPGVVDIYDTFVGNNTGYIVMQYLNGSDVKHILSAQGPMQYEMARDIILSVCDTLMPIHAQNIIHRDISPDNIYITQNGEIKLLDFGAARYESAVNSKSLSVILKSGYAPEEQYRSKGEQGPWTDVYALAATFYKMLTGNTPPDSMERAINDEIQEPSKFGVLMPPSAENALMNALHVNKSDRTNSIYEFKMAILNDGTQRIVVKKRKESSKVPLGAKITISVCAVLLVSLGIFASLGGFESNEEPETIVVGGTQLEDIEQTQEEGVAYVPDFTDMSMEQAEQAAKEQGLTVVIDRKFITGDILQESVIFDQEIAPGETVDEGSEVNVLLHVGDPVNAIARGDIEDVYGLDPLQAAELLEDYKNVMTAEDYEREDGPMFKTYENREQIFGTDPFTLYKFDPNYIEIPSTNEEKGKVLSVNYSEPTQYSDGYFYFMVGTGTQSHNYGEMINVEFGEHVYIPEQTHLLVTIDGGEIINVQFNFVISASTDGGNTFEEIYKTPAYFPTPTNSIMYISENSPNFYNEDLLGKEMILKIERYAENTGFLLDSYTMSESFTINAFTDEITVDSITQLTYDEGKAAQSAGNIDFVIDTVYGEDNAYNLSKEQFDEFYQTYKITGNFTAGTEYNVNQQYSGLYIKCKVPGELYFMIAKDVGDITSVTLDEPNDVIENVGGKYEASLSMPYFVQ